MELQLHNDVALSNPKRDEIERVLSTYCDEDGFFAILSRSEMVYMQVAGSRADGFLLECQFGSLASHYRCSEQLPLETVIDAFTRFALEDDSWERDLPWERDETMAQNEEPRGPEYGTWEHDRHSLAAPSPARGVTSARWFGLVMAFFFGVLASALAFWWLS